MNKRLSDPMTVTLAREGEQRCNLRPLRLVQLVPLDPPMLGIENWSLSGKYEVLILRKALNFSKLQYAVRRVFGKGWTRFASWVFQPWAYGLRGLIFFDFWPFVCSFRR